VTGRPQKINFAQMRASGVTGVLVYCSDYRCGHWKQLNADLWPPVKATAAVQARASRGEPMLAVQIIALWVLLSLLGPSSCQGVSLNSSTTGPHGFVARAAP